MPELVPLTELDRRVPEAGRIRLGVKTARAMKAIDTFRFTSPYRELIEQLADMYGGTAKPWEDARARIKGQQWEVITTSTEIKVFLPQNGLAQNYEAWSGGGLARRCDGITCTVTGRNGEPEQTPCLCDANKVAECKLHTRLNVIIPELPFKGVWRLETKGWNAGHEMPGMFDTIQYLQQSGQMVQALLGLEARSDVKGGKTRNFVVPTVTIAESPNAIMAGEANVGAIAAGGTQVSIGPAPDHVEPELVEGIVLTDEMLDLEDQLKSDAIQFDMDPDRFAAAVWKQAQNDIESAQRAHDRIVAGELEPLGFKPNGLINWITP